jgi:hypothetical protein
MSLPKKIIEDIAFLMERLNKLTVSMLIQTIKALFFQF